MGSANRRDRSLARVARWIVLCSTVTLLAIGATIGLLVSPALAYDTVAILDPSPAEVDVQPGEEFHVTVEIVAEGHADDDVAAVDLVAQYHPDYLEVRALETGPWLGQGEATVESTATVANPDGTAILAAERDPVAGGASGEGELATVTFAVREDADPGQTSIDFESSDVELAGDWPMPVHDSGVTVSIDGSDDPVEPFDHPEPNPEELETNENGSDGETSAGESNETAEADGTSDEEDPIPNGTVLTTVVAAVVMLAYAVYRRA